jgi:hypothetical protein
MFINFDVILIVITVLGRAQSQRARGFDVGHEEMIVVIMATIVVLIMVVV